VRGQPNPQDNARVEALYAGLNDAIKAVRPRGDYVLSICTWGEAGVAGWANRYGAMWRTSPDITPHWESMLHNFDSALANQTQAGTGHWFLFIRLQCALSGHSARSDKISIADIPIG
jgi:hypothetical protein